MRARIYHFSSGNLLTYIVFFTKETVITLTLSIVKNTFIFVDTANNKICFYRILKNDYHWTNHENINFFTPIPNVIVTYRCDSLVVTRSMISRSRPRRRNDKE